MKKKTFLLKEYEIISQRLSSADAYSATFVSIYFVFQAALFTGLILSAGSISQAFVKMSFCGVTLSLTDVLSIIGITTTIWAIIPVTGYFYKILEIMERMCEI